MIKKNNKYFYISGIACIICLGIILRAAAYCYDKSFWYDEAALALNVMDRNIFGLFLKPLDYVQCAPFLFMVSSKLLTSVFGAKESIFRLIPYICSILSIFAFYFLSKKTLDKRWSILTANFLFAVNLQLIRYGQDFKQYSVEVFATIIAILYLERINLESISVKKCILTGFVFFALFLFSMPAPIILTAFLFYLLYKNKKESLKQIFYIATTFTLCALPYYLIYLLPSKKIMLKYFSNTWNPGYLSINTGILKDFIQPFFEYIFAPNNNFILASALSLIGIFLFIKSKKEGGILLLFIVSTALAFSMLHFYPIYARLGLYLVPVIILLITKPLDICAFNTIKSKAGSFIIIGMLIFCFRALNVKYFISFANPKIFHESLSREMMSLIRNDISKNDVIIYDGESLAACIYYLRYFNMRDVKAIPISSITADNYQDLYRGNVWFYFTHHADKKEHVNYVKNLLHNSGNVKILFEKEEFGSYIAKVKL